MSQQLRVLQVEDSDGDAALVRRALEKSGYTVTVQRVETAATMRAALREHTWDVIICDYQLPQFDGRAALELLQSEGLDIPFIVVSGTIGQELAVAMMRAGAHDYMMKDDLSRLGPAVAREVADAQNRQQRRAAEERYRLLFDNALEGIYQSTVAGVIEMANPALAQLMGYASPAELKARLDPNGYVNPEDRRRFVDLIATAGKVEAFEYQAYRKDGSKIWISEYARALRNPQGEIIGYEGSMTDITLRKFTADTLLFLLQQAGAVSETEYYATVARYLSQTLEVDIVCIDRLSEDGQTAQTVANYCDGTLLPNVTYALAGTPCGTLVNRVPCVYPRQVQQLFPRDDALRDLRAEGYIGIGLFASTGQQIGLIALLNHTPLAHPDLAEAVLQIVAVRVAGEMERRQTDLALRQSEASNRLLLENMTDYIARLDQDTKVLFASGAVYNISGYTAEEMPGTNALGRVHPEDLRRVKDYVHILQDPLAPPQTVEYRARCKDGQYKWVEVIARRITNPETGATEYIAVVRDASQRKQMEAALAESKENYQLLFDNINDA
ncbi:MAG: PAS domain S-box protein, partial [Phycisphaerae bacterium]